MSDGPGAALALYAWLSPAFPVGAFAFSHGLEWAVEAGDVHDAATLAAWIDDLIHNGSVRADAVLLGAVWREPSRVHEINDLALALAPSMERRLETASQGLAFLKAVAAAWPTPALVDLAGAFDDADMAYPVALGVVAASHGIALRATLDAVLLAVVSNLVSAALRLGPIGQTDAQTIIARSTRGIAGVAAWAETATLDEIGTCAFRADIASMRHETQYSRLFRS